jgi:hypothetical protein
VPSMCESCSISMKKLILHRGAYLFEIFILVCISNCCLVSVLTRTRIYFLLSSLLPAPVYLFFWSRFHSQLLRFLLPALCPGEQALRSSTRFSIWMRRAGPQVFHSVLHLDAWGWVKVAYFSFSSNWSTPCRDRVRSVYPLLLFSLTRCF